MNSSKTLIIEFSVSTGCNLRCQYCYSDHTPLKMTKEIADQFFNKIDLMLETYNCEKYHISYFGGEPLTNFEIIEYTLPKFENDNRCVSKTVITNGLLLTENIINILKSYNCGISLSFDGISQDITRKQASGISTFQQYLEKRDLFLKMTDSCKVMISPNNINLMTENFEFFVNEYKMNFPDFSLVRDDIYSEKDIENFKFEIKRLADKVIEYNKSENLCSVGFFELYILDMIANKRFGKRDHGCFVGSNGCLYSTDGEFWGCERFRSLKLYPLTENGIPNIKNIEFLNRPENRDPRVFEECKNCEIYEYCNAGCSYSQLLNGRFKRAKPVSSVCKLFKLCYEQAIRVYNNSGENYKNYILNQIRDVL